MFERLTNADLSKALAELIACLGVKEDTSSHDLAAFLCKRETEECVQEIAKRLGMPVRIILSFVPNWFRPGSTEGFRSSALARTEWTGRGVEGITAQVSIPQFMPMYGSSSLNGYPIQVRVSEDCHAYPDTFIAMMAHELSHVLLTSLGLPCKDSELHTDLVPLILGFRNIVRRGRKIVENKTTGNTTTTRTTTYGYLTDAQFDFACDYVNAILKKHLSDKQALIALLGQVQYKLNRAYRTLGTYRDYFRYLDVRPPKKMKVEHAQRVVHLHAQDESCNWESHMSAVRETHNATDSFVRALVHYSSSTIEQLAAHTQTLKQASYTLDNTTALVMKDVRILRRYVGIIHRLLKSLAHILDSESKHH